ncbi:MAG TPA: methylated-DNA--[protein]-cysteine S-methyltransferase [Bacteroidales bacterium]|nr:methylated-DNA--[protein]-cysteine S-methyltransferase [Bacteroidales bacterium]
MSNTLNPYAALRKATEHITMLVYKDIESPLGRLTACSSSEGICFLSFNGGITHDDGFKSIEDYFKLHAVRGTNNHLENLENQLSGYFDGKLRQFTVPLDMAGTPFQKNVWNELLKIKYGSTCTYLEQSVALGNPKSIRAVAHANGSNRIAIVIPCHRVVGTDGGLTGYAAGMERKKWLLEHEKKHSGKEYELSLF